MVAENASNPLKLQDSLLSLDILNLKNSTGLNVESYRSTSSFQPASPLDTSNLSIPSSVQASSQLPFTSGVFTVGSTGQVGIDYLFDGGGYQGELAIFSLQGLESFGLGTPEFIHEVARRAISHSTLGHVVISDQTEGARFSGVLPWEDDFNAGDYLGVRTFAMRPGDTFGIMLVPNGTVQQIFETSDAEGALRPLFSLVSANPNGAFQFGQIADVDGNGRTFAMEDLRLDGESDRDYNDVIFQVWGATGSAVKLDSVIDADHDWRKTDLGQNLMRFIQPPKNQPLIGLIDTGVSSNPDLDPYSIHFGPSSDYVAGDGNPLLQPGEGNQHGTHLAGIIAAIRDNGIGIDGINDKAPLYVQRVVGSGKWAQALVDFVDAAKEIGQPRAIANLSFDLTQLNPDGTTTTRYEFTPEERKALEYARQNGVLIVAAAGNDGGTMSVLGQASQEFDNIITVGAIDYNGKRADYSSFGYGLDIVAYGGTTAQPVMSTVGSGVDLSQWLKNLNSQWNQVLSPLQDQTSSTGSNDTYANNFSTWNLQSGNSSADNLTGQFSGSQSSLGNQLFSAIDENLPDDEMAKNARHIFEEVFGSPSVDEAELETFTPEERQAYDEATKEIDQLLNEYLAEASQKLALEYVDGYYGIQVDALRQFVDAFDENVAQNLIQAQDILQKAGYSIQIPNDSDATASPPLDLGVGWMAGTSVAAARVTGIASQVWASNPDLNYLQIKNILKQTATDLGTPGWDVETGAGAVNLEKAVELAKKTQPETYQPVPILSPLTWTGQDNLFPGERPVWVSVPPFSGRVMNIGDVVEVGYQRIRSGASTNSPQVGVKYPGELITFDAYENNGGRYTDTVLGISSTRWYRIAGTNNWMWAGYIDNNPEQAEQERQRQEAIRQAEEAQRLAEEELKKAQEAARQAEEELKRIIEAEQQRQREVFQALVNGITQKYGDPGLLLDKWVSNGVTVYQFAKGQLLVQPDGRAVFYEASQKIADFFDPSQNGSFGRYTQEQLSDPTFWTDMFKDQLRGLGTQLAYRKLVSPPGPNGSVTSVPRFGRYSKYVDEIFSFLSKTSDKWDDFLAFKAVNPGPRGFVIPRFGSTTWTKFVRGAGTFGTVIGLVPDAYNYFKEPDPNKKREIAVSTGFKTAGSLIGGGVGTVLGSFIPIPGATFVGGVAGSLVGGYLGSLAGDWVNDNWDTTLKPFAKTLEDGWNAASSTVNSALEAAKQKAEEAKQKAQELADKAKAAYQTATAVVQQAKAAYQTFKQEIDKRKTQIVQQSQQKMKEIAQSIAQKVMQNPVVQTASKVFNQVANYANKAVQAVSNVINGAKQFVSNVVETGKQIVNNVIQTGKQAYETVSNFVSSAVNQGTQFATATYNNAAQAVKNVTNFVSGGFSGVKSLFGW
jgi:hypothetical protein